MKDMIDLIEKELVRLAGQVADLESKEFPMSDRTAEKIKRVLDVMHAMDGRKRMIETYVYPGGNLPSPPLREGIDNATFTEV